MIRLLHTLFVAICIAGTALVQAEEPGNVVTLIGDASCPYLCDDDKAPGILIEISTRLLGEAAMQGKVHIMPWRRAVAELASPTATLLVGIRVPGSRDDWLFSQELVTSEPVCFFSKADSDWRYRGPEMLADVDLVVDTGLVKLPELLSNRNMAGHSPITVITADDPLPSKIEIVLAGRSTAFLSERLTARWYLQQKQLEQSFAERGCLESTKGGVGLGVAINRQSPRAQEIIDIIDHGVARLREGGEIINIQRHYVSASP